MYKKHAAHVATLIHFTNMIVNKTKAILRGKMSFNQQLSFYIVITILVTNVHNRNSSTEKYSKINLQLFTNPLSELEDH